MLRPLRKIFILDHLGRELEVSEMHSRIISGKSNGGWHLSVELVAPTVTDGSHVISPHPCDHSGDPTMIYF